MKFPKIGTKVHVEWLDPSIHTMCDLAEAKPAKCWTEGTLVREEKDFVVIASSQYEDGSGDFTVIVKGCCLKISRMR